MKAEVLAELSQIALQRAVHTRHEITWESDGTVSMLYDDRTRAVAEAIGRLVELRRASHVEPTAAGTWVIQWAAWVPDDPARPVGPYDTKGRAEAAEKLWLWSVPCM